VTAVLSTLTAADGLALLCRTFVPPGAVRGAVAIHHGFGEHGGLCEEIGEALSAGGFLAAVHDARGHGRTPGPRGHVRAWSELRDDLGAEVARLREEAPGKPLFLLGDSLGGLVVLDFALRRPEGLAGVVAVGPAVGATGVPAWTMALGRLLSRVWPGFGLDARIDLTNLSRDPERARAIVEDPLYHTRGTARLSTEFEATKRELRARIGELRVPVLVMQGTADRIVSPADTRWLFERITVADRSLEIYEGAVHNLLHDTVSAQVTQRIVGWLLERS
jgi:alpha-beta hydrolase superfamily lysophospholipase